MKSMKIGLLLAGIQVTIAVALLWAARRQVPHVLQDSPLFVGSAAKVSWAINAPVTAVGGGILALLHKARIEPELDQRKWAIFYLAGVALLWFLVGIDVESRLRKRRGRISVDCAAVTVGAVLVAYALAMWGQDEAILTVGAVLWALLLIAFYGFELVRAVALRRTDATPR